MISDSNLFTIFFVSIFFACLVVLIALAIHRLFYFEKDPRSYQLGGYAKKVNLEDVLDAGVHGWFIQYLESNAFDSPNRRLQQVDVDQFAVDVRNVVKRYVIWLINYERSGNNSNQSIDQIAHQMEHLTNLVGQVRDSSLQAKLLALNVAIDAAKCGEGGAEMAFVAEQVRRLSQHSEDFSLNIHKEVNEAKESVQQAKDVVGDRSTKELTAAIATQTHVELLVDELIRVLNGAAHDKTGQEGTSHDSSLVQSISANRFFVWLSRFGANRELEQARLKEELEHQERNAQLVLSQLLSRLENLRDELEFWLLQRSIPSNIRQELFEIIIVLKRLEKAKIGRKNNQEGLAQ